MPAVNGVGEPCAGEPHARIEVAAGGIWCRVQLAETALAPPADPTSRLWVWCRRVTQGALSSRENAAV
jgi:hypothetical protein